MYYENAKLDNGVITEYPVTKETMDAALLAGLSATTAGAEELSTHGMVPVTHAQQVIPQDGYTYTPTTPTLVDDVWVAEKVKDESTPADVIATRTINASVSVRRDRDVRINDTIWRVQRYERNARLGVTQVDDIALLDAYIQALTDVPAQASFPFNITWPELV